MLPEHVELAPFSGRGRALAGFVVCGRWPDTTGEWGEALRLVVRLAAVPGMVTAPTVFHTTDDKPRVSGPIDHAVGLMLVDGPVVGDDSPVPGSLGVPLPQAAMLLHPPGQRGGVGPGEAAAGCLLLPGLPDLGLPHRAAWVEAHADGTVTRLVTEDDVDPGEDPDTAVLAMLVAA